MNYMESETHEHRMSWSCFPLRTAFHFHVMCSSDGVSNWRKTSKSNWRTKGASPELPL